MAEPFLGEIRLVGFTFAPPGWLMANGSLLPISEYIALFSLLGTTYGGDGIQTFALPDLRGRVPVGTGQGPGLNPAVQGEAFGVEQVTLTNQQMPQHNHGVNANSAKGNQPSPAGHFPAADAAGVTAEYSTNANTQMNGGMIAAAGGSQPHENRQPSLVLNWIIATAGIFPSRN